MKNKVFGFAYVVHYIVQMAWSLVLPAGCLIGLGYFLWWRFSLGRWVLAVAIVLGVLCGVYSMFRYIVRASSLFEDNEGRRRGKKNQK